MIIPVVIAATGVVTRSLRNNLRAIPGKKFNNSLQKAAVLGTPHITQEVLHSETGSVSGWG
jgi:hypothetical protein